MSQDISTVVRPQLLSNSAAEFLEVRAQQVLGHEIAGLDGPQYVSEVDKFVSRQELTQVDYFTESQKKAVELKKRLAEFGEKLHTLDKDLKIARKPADQYTMADVLDITQKVKERHQNADKVGKCTELIRKFFRSVGNNSSAIHGLLAFAPGDIYGSVISGSFTLILGAIERAETLRGDIYAAVADIPLKLKEVHDLVDIHVRSAELRRRADTVFVSIFNVLFSIVEELSKNLTRKGYSLIIKGSKYGHEIEDALAQLKNDVDSFRTQANVDHQKQFGRTDRRVTRAMIASENIEVALQAMVSSGRERHDNLEENMRTYFSELSAKIEENQKPCQGILVQQPPQQSQHTAHQTHVLNNYYILFTGTPLFDPKNGQLNKNEYDRRMLEDAKRSRDREKANSKRVTKWIDHLGDGQHIVSKDQTQCLEYFGRFSRQEKSQVYHILRSSQTIEWLKAPDSQVLVVQSQTRPTMIFNPLSFTSSFLLGVFQTSTYPALGFLSGGRTNISYWEKTASPEGMLESLLSQLLLQVKKKQPEVDLLSLRNPRHIDGRIERLKYLGRKLQHLVTLLAASDSATIVLDSVRHLTGNDEENNAALAHILDLVTDSGPTVKILMTDLEDDKVLQGRKYTHLYLPDSVYESFELDPRFESGETLEALKVYRESMEIENSDDGDDYSN